MEKKYFNYMYWFFTSIRFRKEKNKIFVFDEIDNSLHPFLEKELLNIIVKLLKKFKIINNHNKSN